MSKSTISRKSQTDWERLEAMEDRDIAVSDIPEVAPEMFAKEVVRRGLKENKTQLTIRVDRDVLAWFKSQGRG